MSKKIIMARVDNFAIEFRTETRFPRKRKKQLKKLQGEDVFTELLKSVMKVNE